MFGDVAACVMNLTIWGPERQISPRQNGGGKVHTFPMKHVALILSGDDMGRREPYRRERSSPQFNPEDVVMASGMEPASVAAFLHENYLNFVDEASVEDAAAACSYFSDAGPSLFPISSCNPQNICKVHSLVCRIGCR